MNKNKIFTFAIFANNDLIKKISDFFEGVDEILHINKTQKLSTTNELINKVIILDAKEFEKQDIEDFINTNYKKNAFLLVNSAFELNELKIDSKSILTTIKENESKDAYWAKLYFLEVKLYNQYLIEEKEKLKDEINCIKHEDLKRLEELKIKSNSELLSNIAHQWRQPLNIIAMSASSVNLESTYNTLDNEKLSSYMKHILKSSNYLTDIIEEFSDRYSNKNLYKQSVLIQHEISEAIQTISKNIENNEINLVVDIKYKENLNKKLVKGQLAEVLSSLLLNSKDALINRNIKNPWIKLELNVIDKEIIITVEDNAGGIDDEIINKVFLAYTTTEHEELGKGLGLNLCYRLVDESMDGELSVVNTPNGAKFTIVLNNFIEVKSLKIMYVEDETTERTYFEKILKRYIPNVKSFKNGQEALDEYLKTKDYDLIISDIKMPIMDGIDFAKKIRENNQNVPIVITSAFIDSDQKDILSSLNINQYFDKPANMMKVLNSINEIAINS